MSLKMQRFLEAQERQTPIAVDIGFTDVMHIDETVSPGPGGVTYFADSGAAIQLLRQSFTTTSQKLEGILFSVDQSKGKTAIVHASTFSQQNHFVILSLDYDAAHSEWEAYNNGYLRIVTNGAAGGQVARISGIEKASSNDHPSENVAGKLKLLVSKVWDTAQTNGGAGNRASQNWASQTGAPQSDWHVAPTKGDHIVVVRESKLWQRGCPAIITVGEVLQDGNFVSFNETFMSQKVQATLSALGVESNKSIGLPCIFYKRMKSSSSNLAADVPYGSAFTPNVVNLQWVDSFPSVPELFGPRNTTDEDKLRSAIQSVLPNPSTFIDNWTNFHLLNGQVHCGSNAERQGKDNWWKTP